MRRPTLALTLLLAAACTPAPAPGSPAGLPQAAIAALQGTERYPITAGTGETTQFRGQLRVARLEAKGFQTAAAGDGTDLALLLESAEVLDPALQAQIVDPAPVKAADVETFLDDEWDAFQGGKDDAGRQSAEFLKLIKQAGLNVGDFLDLHRQLRMSLKETLSFIEMCEALGSLNGTSGADVLDDVVETLREYHLSPGDFVRIVNEAGQSVEGFLRSLISRQQSLALFLEEAEKAGGALQDSIRRSAALTVQATPETTTREGFRYTPRIDTVVHNAVTGAEGFVIDERDASPDGYRSTSTAKAFPRWLIVGPPANPLAKAEWTFRYGTNARKRGLNKSYMAGIGGDYPTIQSQLGWYLNAAVHVSGVTTKGRENFRSATATISHRMTAHLTFDTAHLWEEIYMADNESGTLLSPRSETVHQPHWTPFRNAVDHLIRY